MNKIDLGSMSRAEMEAYVRSIGEPAFRAGQIRAWLCRGVEFADMTNLSLPLRQKLSDTCYSGLPKIEKKLVSGIDGTMKYLFSFPDGEAVESVVMFYKHGTTICISSQAGCRMGCPLLCFHARRPRAQPHALRDAWPNRCSGAGCGRAHRRRRNDGDRRTA